LIVEPGTIFERSIDSGNIHRIQLSPKLRSPESWHSATFASPQPGAMSQPTIARNGLHILLEILGHGRYSSTLSDWLVRHCPNRDWFENINLSRADFITRLTDCQVGLAILDTKGIGQVSPSQVISTYIFATGSPCYLEKASNRFLSAESITIHPFEISVRLYQVSYTSGS
jgi:hypothetical protein